MLAVGVSNWLRPDAATSPDRLFCHVRNIRPTTANPAGVPKPSTPGPGRPPGARNHTIAPRPDVGKTAKREPTLEAHRAKKAATP